MGRARALLGGDASRIHLTALIGGRGRRAGSVRRPHPVSHNYETTEGEISSTEQQTSGIRRTDLQQHDLGIPGREVVQNRVDIAPGVLAPDHSHPGEEIVYVIEGLLE